MGASYANGQGVTQNLMKAKQYFKKACELKNQDACDNYAKLNSHQ